MLAVDVERKQKHSNEEIEAVPTEPRLPVMEIEVFYEH